MTITIEQNEKIADLERRERNYFIRVWGTSEGLESHLKGNRENYSIEEREIWMKHPSEMTEEERRIHLDIISRAYQRQEANPEYQRKHNARLDLIFEYGFRKDLERIFRGESPEHPEFSIIKMTKEAYRKAETIAKKTVEISNSPNEIYMYLLNYANKEDNTARDVYIPHQQMSPSDCSLSGDSDLRELDRKNLSGQNKKMAGWSHSHGHFKPFHSGTDIENLHIIPPTHGVKKEIWLDTFSEKTPTKFTVWMVPSVVVNALGDKPNLAISVEYYRYKSYEPTTIINRNVRLDLIEENNSIDLREESIVKEILERAVPRTGFKKEYISEYKPSETEQNQPKKEELPKLETVVVEKEPQNQPEKSPYVLREEYMELLKEMFRLEKRTSRLEAIIRKIRKRRL